MRGATSSMSAGGRGEWQPMATDHGQCNAFKNVHGHEGLPSTPLTLALLAARRAAMCDVSDVVK